MKQRNFCTLFDHNYLLKGLALHESLKQHSPGFKLWILAMSEEAETLLREMKLPSTEIIGLSDFEDEELKKVKPTRTVAEYCWTLTPSLPLYILKKNSELDIISYIDGDCFFFSSPEPVFKSFENSSVLIIEHRFSADRLEYLKTGIYNVGLLCFRNDDIGREALHWWRDRCNEWCYYRYEDGKMGDQLYLNDWPRRFKKVLVYKDVGGGVAPWNIWNCRVRGVGDMVFVERRPLIFYHYHGLRFMDNDKVLPSKGYEFSETQLKLIYAPYERALVRAKNLVRRYRPGFSSGVSPREEVPFPINETRRFFLLDLLKTRQLLGRVKRRLFRMASARVS